MYRVLWAHFLMHLWTHQNRWYSGSWPAWTSQPLLTSTPRPRSAPAGSPVSQGAGLPLLSCLQHLWESPGALLGPFFMCIPHTVGQFSAFSFLYLPGISKATVGGVFHVAWNCVLFTACAPVRALGKKSGGSKILPGSLTRTGRGHSFPRQGVDQHELGSI